MVSKISREAKAELIEAVRLRYRGASNYEKGRILDEFVAVTSCHRKHAIRLLSDVGHRVTDVGTAEKTARGFSGFIARVCDERRMMKSEFA